ncbi:MAG: metallophosphoesterase [Synergistaceae bacterium]|jgi:predicted MPP superfamily phosphohydrolase|nr:metallophosphoesterase [Synergistaceae bacterium]MDD4837837.1 metallophosphoesterase [Synergistaceae bacterium]
MNDKAYEKRFSDHPLIWVIFGSAVLFIHIFIFFKIAEAAVDGLLSFVWLALSTFMMFLLFVSRRTKRISSAAGRKWTDRVSGVWMLFVLFTFFFLLLIGFVKKMTDLPLSSGAVLFVSFFLSLLLLGMGIKQANTVQTTVIKVPTSKLPQGCERLRIVQLTDLHLGPFVGLPLLAQILRKVRDVDPDIVVVTGDLADGRLTGRKREIGMLRRIRPRYGMYAVPGNHDYYDDIDEAVFFMESGGMKVLRTEAVEAGGIIIAGADDKDHLIKQQWNLSRSETMVLSHEKEQREKFLLLLRHRPIVEKGTEGHFDLQLSGHTHGGQLFPLLSSRHRIPGYARGLKKLKCGGFLYVSNGAGFVGPPVRLLAPPEIAVIDLVRENERQ